MTSPKRSDAETDRERPDETWPLPKLGKYAGSRYSQVTLAAKGMARDTFDAGYALHLARGNPEFAKGGWVAWLGSLGLSRTWAHEAMAVYTHFQDKEHELEDKPIWVAKLQSGGARARRLHYVPQDAPEAIKKADRAVYSAAQAVLAAKEAAADLAPDARLGMLGKLVDELDQMAAVARGMIADLMPAAAEPALEQAATPKPRARERKRDRTQEYARRNEKRRQKRAAAAR